jgi:hypothetical protein
VHDEGVYGSGGVGHVRWHTYTLVDAADEAIVDEEAVAL